MKRFAAVIFATALVFVAGAFTGRWYESRRPLPPPPGEFMGEIGGHHYGPGRPPGPPPSRADIVAAVERVRPQFEAFKKGMDDIEDQFEAALDAVLTPAQRILNADRIKRRAQAHGGSAGDDNLVRLARLPNMALFRVVTLQFGYDSLNRDLKFDPAQRDQVFALLRARRDHFLAFIDATPPPSLRLVPLAPYAQGVAAPAKP